jgi:hypothetical protein
VLKQIPRAEEQLVGQREGAGKGGEPLGDRAAGRHQLVAPAVAHGVDGAGGHQLERDHGERRRSLKRDRWPSDARLSGRLDADGQRGRRPTRRQREGQEHPRGRGGQQADLHGVQKGQQVLLGHAVEPLQRQLEQPREGPLEHRAGVAVRRRAPVGQLATGQLAKVVHELGKGAGVERRRRHGPLRSR